MRLGFTTRVGHGLTVGGGYPLAEFLDAAADLRGEGGIVATGQLVLQGSAALVGLGALDASDLVFFNGRAILHGIGSVDVAGQLVLSGVGVLEGSGEIVASGQLVLSGSAALEGLAILVADGQLVLSGAGSLIGVGSVDALLTEHKLLLADVRFYLNTARGIVPIVGDLPVFSRSTSAETEDPNGRTMDALPNTPQYTWQVLDEGALIRQILRMQPAHLTDAGTQAVDRLYYPGAPAPQRDALYLRVRVDWDPATDSGHLLWLSSLTGAAPRIRIRHAGNSFFAELHNGTATAEVEVAAVHVAADVVELLVIPDDVAATLELIVANGKEIAGSASVVMPAGGFPADWSERLIVLNGYDQSPTEAGYPEVKILSQEGFSRPGTNRLVDARNFTLSPAGEVVA